MLVGAALLFWGWQTDLVLIGALLAVVLESAPWVQARWEFSDRDFRRIWTFCILLLLAAAIYAFTANEGPEQFLLVFRNPNVFNQPNAGTASAKTAAALIGWLPMVFFPFVAAQHFSARGTVPLEAISLILRRRRKRARKLGQRLPAGKNVDVSFPYFIMCLFAASAHGSETTTFFWGLGALLTWALWRQRSRRFGLAMWAGALGTALALGYLGQSGFGRLQRYLENFDPPWFAHRSGFDATQSKTALGQIGRLKTSGKIVIRLEPKEGGGPPLLLREASYRTWRGQTWYAGGSKNDDGQSRRARIDDGRRTRYAVGGSKNDFETILEHTNRGTWVLLPAKTNLAAVHLACYLEGGRALLPLPAGSGRLEHLPAFLLQKNSTGAVLAEGPGLVMFDARYGPGATIDSAPATSADLSLPRSEEPALAQVISELSLRDPLPSLSHRMGEGREREQALRTISRFFQSKFTYSIWQDSAGPASRHQTPLSYFLLRSRSGHCEYFATATVLLLRELGIPARYAVGYAVHETSGRRCVVRQRDAHAWCLFWNQENETWQDLDTTPASWVDAEAKRASSLEWLWDWWSRIGFELSKFRWAQTHVRQYLLWAPAPILALLLYQILFRSRRQRQRRQQQGLGVAVAWPGLDSEFYVLERKLAERGVERQLSEPLSRWLQRAASEAALAEMKDQLQALLRLHYSYRFDPHGLNQSERERLRLGAESSLARLAGPGGRRAERGAWEREAWSDGSTL